MPHVSRFCLSRRLQLLACCLLLFAPHGVLAQSADLFDAYQGFETAKAANQVAEALKFGNQALELSATQGGSPQDRVQLLSSLGEFAAQAGEDQKAAQYYEQALALQEADLGAGHPDLVPALSALADLDFKAQRYLEVESRLQRILNIERAAYGDEHENVLSTLIKLRQVYQATNNAQGIARVDAQIHPIAAHQRGLSGVKGNVVVDSKRYALKNGYASVRVFYGTNRLPTGDKKPGLHYGKLGGVLEYGYVDVTIPEAHRLAELETAKEWSQYTVLTKTDQRRKYVLLDSVMPLAKDNFSSELRRRIQGSPSKDLFIFIHGYNNTFEDTARRTAQLAYDLDFDGTPIMYSWPSQGQLTGYFADEKMIDSSGPRLAEFLDTVTMQSGAERIHLIAHSMGNRVLLAALGKYLPLHAKDIRKHPFGQMVFTAPDVDRKAFMDTFQSLRGAAQRITLYASDSDYALRASRYYHGLPRAGAAGASVIRLRGLDTIDMSGLPADALGHSYFAANGGAVYDLLRVLWHDDPPDSPQRCSKGDTKSGAMIAVWRFDVDRCKGSDLLEAGVLLKQFRDQGSVQILAQVSDQISALAEPSQRQAGAVILARLSELLRSAAQTAAGVH